MTSFHDGGGSFCHDDLQMLADRAIFPDALLRPLSSPLSAPTVVFDAENYIRAHLTSGDKARAATQHLHTGASFYAKDTQALFCPILCHARDTLRRFARLFGTRRVVLVTPSPGGFNEDASSLERALFGVERGTTRGSGASRPGSSDENSDEKFFASTLELGELFDTEFFGQFFSPEGEIAVCSAAVGAPPEDDPLVELVQAPNLALTQLAADYRCGADMVVWFSETEKSDRTALQILLAAGVYDCLVLGNVDNPPEGARYLTLTRSPLDRGPVFSVPQPVRELFEPGIDFVGGPVGEIEIRRPGEGSRREACDAFLPALRAVVLLARVMAAFDSVRTGPLKIVLDHHTKNVVHTSPQHEFAALESVLCLRRARAVPGTRLRAAELHKVAQSRLCCNKVKSSPWNSAP